MQITVKKKCKGDPIKNCITNLRSIKIMSKLDEQIEAMTKLRELREIRADVELNGIHNPYGYRLVELHEVELRDTLEQESKQVYLDKLDSKILSIKSLVEKLFEEIE